MRAFIIVAILAAAGTAHAYPQFQLSRDATCTGCHLTADGGGLLNENGLNTAEAISMLGTNPEFLNGAWDPPDSLAISGDIRVMGGYLQAPQKFLWAFPMQGEVNATYTKDKLSVHVTAGMRPAQTDNEALTYFWAREHFVQFQTEPGAAEGIFVRAGHFMPVFGLRLVEHPVYTRRYGGTPLFGETYGINASIVKSRFEAHASGFLKNPIMDGVRQESGGALYGEVRVDDATQIGFGAMGELADWNYKLRSTLTAKHYLAGPDLLVQAEVQLVNPHVGDYGYRQIVGYLMASYFAPKGILVDFGFGHYDENLRIKDLDRDCFDLNVHWFATSHIEMMLVNRLELIQWGKGGPTGAYAMLQAHYRL